MTKKPFIAEMLSFADDITHDQIYARAPAR